MGSRETGRVNGSSPGLVDTAVLKRRGCPHGTHEEDVSGGVSSVNSIRKWATQGDIDEGLWTDGLSTGEPKELREFRRKVKQLELEREILGKAAA